MLCFEMCSKIVTAGVCGSAERTLKSTREMNVIVIADVRHNFVTYLAAMQVAAVRELFERKPHVPGF